MIIIRIMVIILAIVILIIEIVIRKVIVIVLLIMLRENSDLRGTVSCGWQPEQGRAVGKTARIWKSFT